MSAPSELRKITAARRRRDKAEDEVREAILGALASRVPVQSIADAAGLSRQRVWQIRKGIR